MGGAKKMQMEHDGLVQSAVVELVKAEYGSECEIHDGTYIDGGNEGALEEAIDEAVSDPEWSELGREKIEEIFTEASNWFGLECGACAKNVNSD